MIVPKMSLTEKLAHARADLVSVNRKFERKVGEMQHALKASRHKRPLVFQTDYRSPENNTWFITLRVTKKRTDLFPVIWWQYPECGLEAFSVTPTGAFYFDTHFVQRYRLRESEVVSAVDNARTFFRANYDITIKILDTYRHGLQEAAGVAEQGLFLGTVREGGIVACDTYVAEDMLHGDQQKLRNELLVHGLNKHLSPVQLQQMRAAWREVMRQLDELDKEG